MNAIERRLLATRIADRLFMNGRSERAERLVLTRDTPKEMILGGWCKAAAIDQIVAVIADVEQEATGG